MAINAAYLELRLSGGAANTDPSVSLGGVTSSERVLSQSTTALTNVTGVTIEYAAGNPLGLGTLTYTNSGQTLTWTAFSGGAGTAVAVGVTGKYTIRSGSGGFLFVSVTSGSLPGTNQSDNVTIANIANETFDNVTKEESFAGDTEYRCFYYKNTHSTDPFIDVILFIGSQPSPVGSIAIGADTAGVGLGTNQTLVGGNLTRSGSTATAVLNNHGFLNGRKIRISGADQVDYNGLHTITYVDVNTFTFPVNNSPATPATGTIVAGSGVPSTVANESTAPSGVTFTSPSSEVSGVQLGQLNAGEVVAFWERRIIPARNVIASSATVSVVSAQTYF